MKVKLILFFGLLSVVVRSQETPGFQIPNYAPKTPEATAFLKYGEYPVDLSTGVPEISIPIYTIDNGSFQLPINLSYHASGIKVAQEATWVGLGWNLNFGAQIILNVKEDVDENNSRVYDLPDADVLDYYNTNLYDFNYGPVVTEELGKSRVKDIYSFTSPTVSGSFFWDPEQNKYVSVPPDAFRVDAAPLASIRITDVNGNIYKFNTKEISYRTQTHGANYTSAWYVSEIETPDHKKIQFHYQDDGEMYDYSTLQRLELKDEHPWTYGGTSGPTVYSSMLKTDGGTTVTAAKKIHEIVFDNGDSKVIFDKTENREDLVFNDVPNPVTSGRNGALEKIRVLHRKSSTLNFELVKSYFFGYSYFNPNATQTSQKRLKLESLSVSDDGTYEFIYNDSIPLPDKKSNAQDIYGYYNGRVNVNMVPEHVINFPNPTIFGGADRSVYPDKNQAGILKQIYYPTKGYTRFNYETNQYFGTKNHRIVNEGCSVLGVTETGIGTANPDPSDIDTCTKYISIPVPVNMTITCSTTNSAGGIYNDINKHHYMMFKLLTFDEVGYVSPKYYQTDEHTININLDPGEYTLTLMAYGSTMQISAHDIVYTYSTEENIDAAGLRIKSIENLDHDGVTVLTKKQYSYNDLEIPSKTSGRLINPIDMNFISIPSTHYTFGHVENIPAVQYTQIRNIMSQPRNPVDGNVVYRYVKESEINVSDGKDKGYTLYEFTTDGDLFQMNAGINVATISQNRGKILKKYIFRRIPDDIPPYYLQVAEETNTYFDDSSKIAYVKGFKLIRYSTTDANGWEAGLGIAGSPATAGDQFDGFFYNYPVKWKYLKTKQVTEFFYDESNNPTNSITSLSTFDYDNPLHQQLSRQSTTSSAGETIEVNYFYPQDASMASQPFVAQFGLKHMLAKVLKKESFRNSTKISETLTAYDYNTVEDLLLPKFIYAKKGDIPGDPELKFTYDKYSNEGALIEYSTAGGMKTSLIWDLHNLHPVAKLENIAYDNIPGTLITNIKNALGTGNETNISTALNALRNSPEMASAMVTTYTYTPLVGVNSITDPKGIATYYEYDEIGRLKAVRDNNGYLLSENFYHYKN